MHGRKKLTAEQREQKAARELSKISEYCALVDAFEQLPGSTNQPASSPLPMTITQEWDSHVRPLLDQLLNWNPEYYSVWNYRRRVLQSLNKDGLNTNECWTDAAAEEYLKSELKITQDTLRLNPKSYWIWLHRRWVNEYYAQSIATIPVDWQKELMLCNQLLDLDSRNFHCWDYRRTVLKHLSTSTEKELEFTMHKICQNFSNYSAWHYRSVLYSHDKQQLVREDLEEDLELVRSAVFTEPKDQSPWLYHRWATMQIQNTCTAPICAYISPSNNRLIIVFDTPVISQQSKISLTINGVACEFPALNSQRTRQYCQSWIFDLSAGDHNSIQRISIQPECFRSRQRIPNKHVDITLTTKSGLRLWLAQEDYSKRNEILSGELESIGELLSLEPDSKWALLTYCFALMELQKTQGDLTAEQWSILDQYLTRLKSIDSCRREYYADYLTRIKAIQSMDWPTLIARQIVTVKILEKCLDGVELDLRSLDESALSCLASYPLLNLMVRPEPFSAPSHEP